MDAVTIKCGIWTKNIELIASNPLQTKNYACNLL